MKSTTKVPSRAKQATVIMKHFDFDLMAESMNKLGWTWADTKPKTPTVQQLKETARELLDSMIEDNEATGISTGGFHAYVDKWGWMRLDFVAVECDASDYLAD